MSRTLAISIAFVLLGCKGRPAPGGESPPASASPFVVSPVAPPSDDEKKSAEDLAMTYLGAMGSKDCSTLVKIVASYKSADCKEDVDDWVEHKTQFVAFENLARDGRDQAALLVTAKMIVNGSARSLVVRVRRDGDAWRVHK